MKKRVAKRNEQKTAAKTKKARRRRAKFHRLHKNFQKDSEADGLKGVRCARTISPIFRGEINDRISIQLISDCRRRGVESGVESVRGEKTTT